MLHNDLKNKDFLIHIVNLKNMKKKVTKIRWKKLIKMNDNALRNFENLRLRFINNTH